MNYTQTQNKYLSWTQVVGHVQTCPTNAHHTNICPGWESNPPLASSQGLSDSERLLWKFSQRSVLSCLFPLPSPSVAT